MPVKVRCTSCDKVLTVPDAARGKAVKCPGCQERIAVPDEDSSSGVMKVPGKSGGDKARKKGAAKPEKRVDSEDALASFDLRKAEDTNARICFKCGFDMQYLDEEETECPECGYDSAAGGLGKKAQKRAMKGPDPADFYPGLAKSAWKFVVKNQSLAWRTDAYVAVCLLISMFCAFMYLWISAWPPRAFFALCFTVAIMVIPGWLWLLDIEIIQLTLERKDKFKRFNFDFFLASAMGLMFVAWCAAIVVPLMAVPVGIGYYLVNYSGYPPWALGVCVGIGAIPALWMLPISMSHMAMPVTLPGWMIWKVVPTWVKTIAPLSVWLMWLFLTTLPLTGAAGVIGGVWGSDIEHIVTTMEDNARIHRERLAAENAPKGKNAPPAKDPNTIGTIAEVDLKPLIGPAIILLLTALPIGWIAMFNMRINGQFTYFNKTRLDMIDKRKEYKYVAKEKVDEDEEDKPRTLKQDATDGSAIAILCMILGGVGGMVFGNMTQLGTVPGIIQFTFWSSVVGTVVGFGVLVGVVYPIQRSETGRKGFFTGVISLVVMLLMLVLASVGVMSLGFLGGSDAVTPVDPNQAAPAGAAPAGMPMPTGAMPAGQMPGAANAAGIATP
ncbi:MAG: hypothetical protein H7062_10870 [Candidatus Saccharimonas sp.]|nr:hypothetical protein [Planctomycetaceae bacterium]